jgi:hypothetical protein
MVLKRIGIEREVANNDMSWTTCKKRIESEPGKRTTTSQTFSSSRRAMSEALRDI